MNDRSLIEEFIRTKGVRRIPRGVCNRAIFEELPDAVRGRRLPQEITPMIKAKIEEQYPLERV